MADPASQATLLETMRELRIITAEQITNQEHIEAFYKLMTLPQSLSQLIAVIEPSVSKLRYTNQEERYQKIQIVSEAIRTIDNLVVEGKKHNIDERLFLDYNIHRILLMHLQENFIEDVLQPAQTLTHYSQGGLLEGHELNLLNEIFWLLSNLQKEEAIAYQLVVDGIAEQVYLIAHAHQSQFNLDTWRVMLWQMRMATNALRLFQNVNIGPYYNFLSSFQEVII